MTKFDRIVTWLSIPGIAYIGYEVTLIVWPVNWWFSISTALTFFIVVLHTLRYILDDGIEQQR